MEPGGLSSARGAGLQGVPVHGVRPGEARDSRTVERLGRCGVRSVRGPAPRARGKMVV